MLAYLIPELLEQIFTEVDKPKDLLHLSVVCKTFKALIIPNQLNYRIITISQPNPNLYAHLAQRPDLTSRIRFLEVTRPIEQRHSRAPKWIDELKHDREASVVGGDSGETKDPQINAQNLAKAISFMTRLKSIRWRRYLDGLDPLVEFDYEPLIFRALLKRKSLVDVYLEVGCDILQRPNELLIKEFTAGAVCRLQIVLPPRSRLAIEALITSDSDIQTYKLPNVKKLILRDMGWQDIRDIYMLQFLYSATNIEYLEIPGLMLDEDRKIHLPNLKRLDFSFTFPDYHPRMYQFLLDNPSIEHLTWYPQPGIPLLIDYQAGLLPNLKTLKGTHLTFQLFQETYQKFDSHPQWKLESLEVGLDAQELNALQCIDRTALKEFSSLKPDTVENVREMGRLFPNIRELTTTLRPDDKDTGGNGVQSLLPPPFEMWLDALPNFQSLEIFFDDGNPKEVIPMDDEEFRDALIKLSTLCPRLKEIRTYLLDIDAAFPTAIRLQEGFGGDLSSGSVSFTIGHQVEQV